jgi:ubiquinone/menaquinone biosynthesis C-methylase UbiE
MPRSNRTIKGLPVSGIPVERITRKSAAVLLSIEHCVTRLAPRPGERILDLATGTGWTSRPVARRGAQVVGVDLGADLVATASERAKAAGLDIEYRVGDAESLPFADGEFDAVISTCGIMFATQPTAAAVSWPAFAGRADG